MDVARDVLTLMKGWIGKYVEVTNKYTPEKVNPRVIESAILGAWCGHIWPW